MREFIYLYGFQRRDQAELQTITTPATLYMRFVLFRFYNQTELEGHDTGTG
jgi:hypothetical protein